MELGITQKQASEWHDAPSVVEPNQLQDHKTDQGIYLPLGFLLTGLALLNHVVV